MREAYTRLSFADGANEPDRLNSFSSVPFRRLFPERGSNRLPRNPTEEAAVDEVRIISHPPDRQEAAAGGQQYDGYLQPPS